MSNAFQRKLPAFNPGAPSQCSRRREESQSPEKQRDVPREPHSALFAQSDPRPDKKPLALINTSLQRGGRRTHREPQPFQRFCAKDHRLAQNLHEADVRGIRPPKKARHEASDTHSALLAQSGPRADEEGPLSLTPRFSEVVCARREDPTVSTVFCSPPSAGVRWQDLSLLTSAPTVFKTRSQPSKISVFVWIHVNRYTAVEDQEKKVMKTNRRRFLKLSAAAAAGAAVSHLPGCASRKSNSSGSFVESKLTNWAGNYRYSTGKIYRANSLEQVCSFVKQHRRFKVLGTRHCFNGIADSPDDFLSLREMNRVVALDPKARTVTVEAGMSYGQLGPFLHEQGFALHNLASLPHISIAGACATATHGSGVKNANLAAAVSALEIVTADGQVLKLSREKDGSTFQAAVVNLGALGVVTKVTLDVEPTFLMRQDVYLNLPTGQLVDHFEDIVSAGYSVSLFTDWQKGRINEVWIKRRVEDRSPVDATPEFYGATLATRNVHPIIELAAETNGLPFITLTEKGLAEFRIDGMLKKLGQRAGPPWRVDERAAATAAWVALKK